MEEDGSMPQDAAPLGQAPQHDPTADPAIGRTDKVLSIEDAKAVTMAMLSPWSQDHLQNREIQRLWPDVDSNLPRGALVPPSGAPKQSRGGARKRQRTEQHQPPPPSSTTAAAATTATTTATTTTTTTPAEPSFTLLEDGTLQKPSIPGVSPETTEQAIKEILKDMRKACGVCRPCRARAAGQHSLETHCPTLKAFKAWDNEFGGVPYAVAEEMARKLAQPLMHGKTSVWKNRKRSGDGIRCEACASCRRDLVRRYKCKFLIALQEKKLPQRFRDVVNAAEVAVMESLPAPVRASVAAASAAANQVTLEQYIDQYMPTGVHTNRSTTTNTTTATAAAREPGNPTQLAAAAVDGDSDGEIDEEGDELEDEENMRWSGWAPFLSHPQALQYMTSTSTAADSTRMNTKQQVAFIAQRLGVDKESLVDWICTAKVDEAECGHVNSRQLFHCESCTTPRWSGPVGQLSTRIISALQSGIWIGTAGRSTIEVESDLASTVAARIAAEAGPGAEELPEMDGLMEKVHDEIQRVRTAREVPVGTAVARGGNFQKEEQLKAKVGIARRTKMGKSVSQLQTAVGRLVEEQIALREFKLAKEKQEKTAKKGDGVVGTYQKKMNELVQLRSLLIESKEHPFHWDVGVDLTGAAVTTTPATAAAAGPSTSKRQRSGRSAASGLERPSFIGYSAFCQRITNALSQHQHNTSIAVTLAAGYQLLCDMLFISAPPLSSSVSSSSTPSLLSSRGWTEGMVLYLEIVLKGVEATKQLMLASQIGGPVNVFRHVLWALLQRQQRKQREETAAAAEGGGGTGSRAVHRETPSQPSQRPNPFLIPTQQSQPDTSFLPLSQSQPQSQGTTTPATTVAATAVAADAAFDTSIALLDDLINAIDPSSTAIATTTTTTGILEEEEEIEIEERQDQHRMNVASHMTSTTLQIVYDLTQSVLNSVALKEAKERMPVHLTPFLKTILEQAQFPDFPPLPPPLPLSPLTTIKLTAERATTRAMNPNRFDLHDVVKPIPDSRHRVQDMVKGILPRKGRPPRVKATDQEMQLLPSKARSGAFSAFKPVESVAGGSSDAIKPTGRSRGEVERAKEQQSQQQEEARAEIMKQCPADVQLVFSEAINSGVRPEVVYKAAMRYLATVEMGK